LTKLHTAQRRAAGQERLREAKEARDRARVGRALIAALTKASRTARRGQRSSPGRNRVTSRGAGSFTRRGKTPLLLHKKAKGGANADGYAERKAIHSFGNMLGLNARERAAEFAQDARRHPRARAAGVTRHSILSFSPGIEITVEQAERATRAWVKRIGADGNFVAHVHEELRGGVRTLHVHVLWSRSLRDGRLLALSHDYYVHRQAAHDVAEALFGTHEIDRLGFVECPAAPTDVAARAAQRARRLGGPAAWVDAHQVRQAITVARTPAELQQLLLRRGIELQVSRRPDGSPRGLLLRRAGAREWLSAGAIARDLSFPRVQAALAENHERYAQKAQRSAPYQDHNLTPADRPRGG